MIKRKLVSALVAATMLTTVFATTAFAEDAPTIAWDQQGGSSTVEGSTYPVEPTIEVAIPGELTFGLNPLNVNVAEEGATADTRQIVASDYAIVNHSNVAVVINTKTTATQGADVNLMSTATYDDKSGELTHDATNNKKNVFLCMSYVKEAKFQDDAFTYTYGADVDSTITDATSANGIGAAILTNATAVENNFRLAAASDDMKDASASFTFKGKVDPQSTYADGDVTVSTVYTLTAITKNQYDKSWEADDTYTGVASTVVKAKN